MKNKYPKKVITPNFIVQEVQKLKEYGKNKGLTVSVPTAIQLINNDTFQQDFIQLVVKHIKKETPSN